MADFVCDNCESVQNTARGHYWARDLVQLMGHPLGKALCTECMPTQYANGKEIEADYLTTPGEWCGRRPKEKWDGKEKVVNR